MGLVVANEVSALKRAVLDVGGKECAVTFLCVNKRHHVRFFSSERDAVDRNGNLVAGSCIDSGLLLLIQASYIPLNLTFS